MKRVVAWLILLTFTCKVHSVERFQPLEKRISPELVGFNLLYWIDDQAHFERGKLVKQINGIKPALLRYPAGTASQNYDWRSNSVINPNLFPFNPTNELLTTDAYIETVKQTGAKGIVVVDITSAHLKDRKKAINKGQPGYMVAQPVSDAEEQAMIDKAVAWAKHFKEKDFSPAFYELGNEHYLAFLDYMVYTPEFYAAKCKRFMDAIRAVDPDAKFAVCGPAPFDHGHYYYKKMPWWPIVLKELAGDINRIVLHNYWRPDQITGHFSESYDGFRDQLCAWGEQTGVDVDHLKIGFTEWGGRGDMDEETFGLFAFRVLADMADKGIDYAVEWPFRWEDNGEFGNAQLIRIKGEQRTFAYRVLAGWSRYFSGKQIAGVHLDLLENVFAFAAVGDDGAPVLGVSNENNEAVDIPLDLLWPENFQTLEISDVSVSKDWKKQKTTAGDLKSIHIPPRTIRIVQAGQER